MFTNSTQYAIRAVLFLSRKRSDNNKLKVDDISQELNIPKPFLSKILQQLSRNDIISSSKGRGGGFYLSDDNANKTLLDVVVCMEGHNIFDKCILGLPQCNEANPCHLHQYYIAFKKDLKTIITDATINDLFYDDQKRNYKI